MKLRRKFSIVLLAMLCLSGCKKGTVSGESVTDSAPISTTDTGGKTTDSSVSVTGQARTVVSMYERREIQESFIRGTADFSHADVRIGMSDVTEEYTAEESIDVFSDDYATMTGVMTEKTKKGSITMIQKSRGSSTMAMKGHTIYIEDAEPGGEELSFQIENTDMESLGNYLAGSVIATVFTPYTTIAYDDYGNLQLNCDITLTTTEERTVDDVEITYQEERKISADVDFEKVSNGYRVNKYHLEMLNSSTFDDEKETVTEMHQVSSHFVDVTFTYAPKNTSGKHDDFILAFPDHKMNRIDSRMVVYNVTLDSTDDTKATALNYDGESYLYPVKSDSQKDSREESYETTYHLDNGKGVAFITNAQYSIFTFNPDTYTTTDEHRDEFKVSLTDVRLPDGLRVVTKEDTTIIYNDSGSTKNLEVSYRLKLTYDMSTKTYVASVLDLKVE